jgi:antitoxin component of RelBE/YafQ-DinJ toxin-antitoxin module
MDKKVKAAAHRAARDIGIPLSTVVGAYLRKFARDREVYFNAPLVPTPKAARWIREARKEFDEGKTKSFATMEELIADLHK